MACKVFLTLQPGNVKMPALGYGTWQVSCNLLYYNWLKLLTTISAHATSAK